MACYTQEEAAERENLTKQAVSQFSADLPKLDKSQEPAAAHLNDFDPPLYNVWKRQEGDHPPLTRTEAANEPRTAPT